MLVSIFREGREKNEAPLRLHFDSAPVAGDLVEVEGKLSVVSRVWHKPDDACIGSKFAVLLRPHSEAKAA